MSLFGKLICTLRGHHWNGCKCLRCGEVRDMAHHWKSVSDDERHFCSNCRKIAPHVWEGCKCSACGQSRPHLFGDDGVCTRCGEQTPPPQPELTYEERMANADEGIFNGGVRAGW